MEQIYSAEIISYIWYDYQNEYEWISQQISINIICNEISDITYIILYQILISHIEHKGSKIITVNASPEYTLF